MGATTIRNEELTPRKVAAYLKFFEACEDKSKQFVKLVKEKGFDAAYREAVKGAWSHQEGGLLAEWAEWRGFDVSAIVERVEYAANGKWSFDSPFEREGFLKKFPAAKVRLLLYRALQKRKRYQAIDRRKVTTYGELY